MSDPYNYIEKNFTTEIYKIEVSNLPVNTYHTAFMKFLRKKGIKYRKVKVVSKTKLYSFAFITLKSQDDREKAIEILNRSKFRGKELVCKQSIPLPDPLIVKRINQPDSIVDNNYDNLSTNERNKFILDKVCSLWQLPYCDQINRKIDRLQSTFQKCYKTLKTLNNSNLEIMSTLNWFRSFQLKDKFIFSPQTEGYRNKYEFNVGSDNRVGFRLGLYRNGSIKVVNPPDNCPIISSQANLIWKHFQKYLLEKTSLNGYNPITHKGYWRQILVRLNQSNESLISISLTRQPELSDEELEKECENICKHFNEDPKLNIKSIYIDFILNSTYSEKPSKCFRHLTGVTHIFESIKISDNEILKFRISPTSFFQINILAAELLYRKILELAKCTPETILLDICCGTGTIGLCLASRVKRVLAFELNEEAIKDAKYNAQLNNCNNVEFYCGRAENQLMPILESISASAENLNDFVAILNPPRNGLPVNIIKSIRNNIKIKRVVYVACEALAARQNFIDLCRPRSNAYYREAFVPVTAVPIDMFPHTDQCELVIMFERISCNSLKLD